MIWYVAYGSNLLFARFRHYLDRCDDPSDPREQRRVTIPYARYFAREWSDRWGLGGVAFLDVAVPAETLGRAYLLTDEQLAQVHALEGRWYDLAVDLAPYDGIPVRTFTSSERLPDNPPGDAYRRTVEAGEAETLRL